MDLEEIRAVFVYTISSLKSQGVIKGQVFSYRALGSARSACYEHSVKPARIVLGNYPYYWVVTPADAERLIRAGYEETL